jgi:hypothetical protein
MGANKSTPMWVDPPNPNIPVAAQPGVIYEEPEVYFTKGGKPDYPVARGPGYTPFRDPLPEMPTVYNKAGKAIKPKGVPPGYVPPGANFPPVPKGCQMVNGPKGPTLLCKSKSIAAKCDMADGFADGMWFGIPLAVGIMLEAPPMDYGDEAPIIQEVPVPYPVPVQVAAPAYAAPLYPSVVAAPGPYLY